MSQIPVNADALEALRNLVTTGSRFLREIDKDIQSPSAPQANPALPAQQSRTATIPEADCVSDPALAPSIQPARAVEIKHVPIVDYEKVYDKLAEAMWKEEEIVSRRVGWLLTIQAVIIAGIGALLTGDPKLAPENLSLMVFVLHLAGSGSALLAGVGVLASKMGADFYRTQIWIVAQQALESVRSTYDEKSGLFVTSKDEAAFNIVRFPATIRLLNPTHRGRGSVLFGRLVDCGLPWLLWFGWLMLAKTNIASEEGFYVARLGSVQIGWYGWSAIIQVTLGMAFLLYYFNVSRRAIKLDTWWDLPLSFDQADPAGLVGGDRASEGEGGR